MFPLLGFTITHIKAAPLGPLAGQGSEVGERSVFTEQQWRGGAGWRVKPDRNRREFVDV